MACVCPLHPYTCHTKQTNQVYINKIWISRWVNIICFQGLLKHGFLGLQWSLNGKTLAQHIKKSWVWFSVPPPPKEALFFQWNFLCGCIFASWLEFDVIIPFFLFYSFELIFTVPLILYHAYICHDPNTMFSPVCDSSSCSVFVNNEHTVILKQRLYSCWCQWGDTVFFWFHCFPGWFWLHWQIHQGFSCDAFG